MCLSRTYLALIQNSIGTKMFQSLFVDFDGKIVDVLRSGELSCAYYVSSILRIAGLIAETHATITKTIKDMEASGWYEIQSREAGCVLVWEEQTFDNQESHTHIGFYIGDDMAISNSDVKRCPVKHHWTFGQIEDREPARKVIAMYWHDLLDS